MKKIAINYNGSGVKTLRLIGILFLLFGIISTIGLLQIGRGFANFIISFSPTIVGLATIAVFNGLAKLVELSLIAKEQRAALLEKEGIQLEFVANEVNPAASTAEAKKDSEV